MSNNKPIVSVIVYTRNSDHTLDKSLENLRQQTYKNIEIIVVDNNSTDQTKKVARKYTSLVYNKGPERASQINFGVKKAKGKYIFHTGSDIDRDRDLIEQAVAKMEEEGFDAIYLNVLTKLQSNNIWEKVRALERKIYYREKGMSAARIYKKSVFLKIGGVDENIGGASDDLDFQDKIDSGGFRTGLIDAKEYTLREYASYYTIITRSLYYGWYLNGYLKKNSERSKKQYSLIRPEFIKNKKILTKDKSLFLFFVIYKLTQYFFGIIGVFLCRVTGANTKVKDFLYNLNYK